MKYYLFGNWKCNPVASKDALSLFSEVAKGVKKGTNVEAAVFPPFCYLPLLLQNPADIAIGAQNCHVKESGAYTGEVSARQIADLGCRYVLAGHSERRRIFSETDAIVNEKAKIALSFGLTPVVCVGETDEDRSAGRAMDVIKSQLAASLKDIDYQKIIIAYEPVWAIGTGKACGVAEAREINELIKKEVGQDAAVLYGGSANPENGVSYLKEAGYNGLLVGGASLKAGECIKMFNGIEELR
jgi:triosephosphate isomerase